MAERSPIVYLRGYAGPPSGVDKQVDDPFHGLNSGEVHAMSRIPDRSAIRFVHATDIEDGFAGSPPAPRTRATTSTTRHTGPRGPVSDSITGCTVPSGPSARLPRNSQYRLPLRGLRIPPS
ncbi:hypothetical protein SAMN05216511_6853 [Streptomyces sp. KS_16]|nr:hypothetical protein BX261_0368 [Streptomyces sp. 2321.6]SDR58199.1 hypothetical protein SAMN05216511_6853 [Streptomyces sp. KS_16]SEB78472.1 hypothetical protein SAMN05428940_0368 [Streptomyces sp. 2133.1]SNC60897.1 hypothetical protein SAMN06272741_0369 [Streptomyces sp. 2114.4]